MLGPNITEALDNQATWNINENDLVLIILMPSLYAFLIIVLITTGCLCRRCDRKTCDKQCCPDPVQRETRRAEIFCQDTSSQKTTNDGRQVVSETSAIELEDSAVTHRSLRKRVLKTFEAVEKARERNNAKRRRSAKAAEVVHPEGDGDNRTEQQVLEDLMASGAGFEFLSFKRSFKQFQEMPHGRPLASASNRQTYGFGRMVVYRTLKGTTFSHVCESVGILVCYSALCCSIGFACRTIDNQYSGDRRLMFDSFISHCNAAAKMIDSLYVYLAFVVVTYATEAMNRWKSIYAKMNDMSIGISSYALLWSQLYPGGRDLEALKMKFKVYRWLNTLHLFAYMDAKAQTNQDRYAKQYPLLIRRLFDCGLLVDLELEELSQVIDCKSAYQRVCMWLSELALASELHGIGVAGGLSLSDIVLKLKRAQCMMVADLKGYPPYEWGLLVQLLVDLYLLVAPIGFIRTTYIIAMPFQLFTLTSTFLASMFFLGFMALVDITRDPFGTDVDSFFPDSPLLESDRTSFLFLSSGTDPSMFDETVLAYGSDEEEGMKYDLLTLEERNLINEQQRKRLLASNLRTRIFDKYTSDGRIEKAMALEKKSNAMKKEIKMEKNAERARREAKRIRKQNKQRKRLGLALLKENPQEEDEKDESEPNGGRRGMEEIMTDFRHESLDDGNGFVRQSTV